jgi:hypothetical protein
MLKHSQQDILIKFHDIHGERYNYNLVQYENYHKKVKIVCHIHGIFEQSPGNHIAGKGCRLCSSGNQRTLEEISNKIKEKFCNITPLNYKSAKDKLDYTCICGFTHSATLHSILKTGCKQCNKNKCTYQGRWSQKEFVNQVNRRSQHYTDDIYKGYDTLIMSGIRNEAIKIAHDKGYAVSECGTAVTYRNKERKLQEQKLNVYKL